MSIIPFIMEDLRPFRPSRILNQQFGLGLEPEDLVLPFDIPQALSSRFPLDYYRPWRSAAANQDTGSTVCLDKDKFQVNLDVQHFSPEEITVKVTGDNTITVEGKHEEKKDNHGYVSRQFVRRYVLPKGHDIEKVVSSLSSDGVLSITAPKQDAIEDKGARTIPVKQTGVPMKSVENKKEKEMDVN